MFLTLIFVSSTAVSVSCVVKLCQNRNVAYSYCFGDLATLIWRKLTRCGNKYLGGGAKIERAELFFCIPRSERMTFKLKSQDWGWYLGRERKQRAWCSTPPFQACTGAEVVDVLVDQRVEDVPRLWLEPWTNGMRWSYRDSQETSGEMAISDRALSWRDEYNSERQAFGLMVNMPASHTGVSGLHSQL